MKNLAPILILFSVVSSCDINDEYKSEKELLTKAINTTGNVEKIRAVEYEVFELDSMPSVDDATKAVTESYTKLTAERVERYEKQLQDGIDDRDKLVKDGMKKSLADRVYQPSIDLSQESLNEAKDKAHPDSIAFGVKTDIASYQLNSITYFKQFKVVYIVDDKRYTDLVMFNGQGVFSEEGIKYKINNQ